MMQNQSAAASADQARAILGAWNSGNIQLFRQELDRVQDCPVEASESEEMERIELLRAIAADLRVPAIQPAAGDPDNIYSNLLRHLAFSHSAQVPGLQRRPCLPAGQHGRKLATENRVIVLQ